MPRRRLTLHCSSSSEDERQQQYRYQPHHQQIQEDHEDEHIELELQDPTLNLETVTLNPNPNPNSNISLPAHLEISDDDFVDVHESLSPPPPRPPVNDQFFQSSAESRISSASSSESSDCPISAFLHRLGLRLRREWLDSCIQGLERSVPGFASLDLAAKAKLCFKQFLLSDMNYSGGGVLPENVHNMNLVDLAGPFVLQVCFFMS
ncbi:hypothetical protein CsSME_00007163 [Camellia sinensis var. sinensis]